MHKLLPSVWGGEWGLCCGGTHTDIQKMEKEKPISIFLLHCIFFVQHRNTCFFICHDGDGKYERINRGYNLK